MKVLNYGSLNIDNIYYVESLVENGSAQVSTKFEVTAGGKGLNQSLAIRKAGFKEIYHAGNIGRNGDFLKYTLLEHDIHIDYITRSNYETGHAIVQLAEVDHTIIVYPGSNEHNDKDMIDMTLEQFDSGDILLVQNEINNVDYLIQKGYEKGLKVFFNPSPISSWVKDYPLHCLDTIILNENEYSRLFDHKPADEVVKAYGMNLLLTQKRLGGDYFGLDGSVIHYDGISVKSVDTTAVGDVFVGFFTAFIAKEYSVREALNISAKAAAYSTLISGSTGSIPSLRDVVSYFGKEGVNRES